MYILGAFLVLSLGAPKMGWSLPTRTPANVGNGGRAKEGKTWCSLFRELFGRFWQL